MKRFLITLSVLGNLAVLLGVGGLYYFTDGFAFFRAQRERVRSLYEALPVQARDIVFLGDSITAEAQWNELFPRLPTKNRGIGGDTTDDVLARLHTVTSGKPAKVFLKIGTNDLMAQVSTDEIADNVATILDRIHAASPDTRLYLQSVLPRDALLTPAVRELNAKLEAVAQARNVTWVDVFPVFLDEDGRSIRDDFANDELHLTGAGYVAWRVALAPYVRAKPARARVAPASALPKRKRGKPAGAVQRRLARILSQHESLPIEPGDIVFLGDSITQGAAWNEMFPNQRVRNRGLGGETTIRILDRLPSVTSGRPGKVFLMIGTNDLMGQVPAEEVAGNVATILEQIQQNSPTTKLYLQSVLPRDALLTARVRDLNRQLEEIALARNITWVDIFPAFLDENGTSIRNDLSNDELHLTGAGYLAWRDALTPYVRAKPPKPGVSSASARPKRRNSGATTAPQRSRKRLLSQHEGLPIKPGDIVFLGDSITAGAAWNELFPNQRVRNRGIGGDTTADVLDRLHTVTSGHPAKIFLQVGTNDLTQRISAEEVAANVATILDRIEADSPETKLYLQSVLPRGAFLTPTVQQLNRRLEAVASTRNVTWIDVFPVFLNESGTAIRDGFSNDRVHLLGAGYLAWRDALTPYLPDSEAPAVVTGAPSG